MKALTKRRVQTIRDAIRDARLDHTLWDWVDNGSQREHEFALAEIVRIGPRPITGRSLYARAYRRETARLHAPHVPYVLRLTPTAWSTNG